MEDDGGINLELVQTAMLYWGHQKGSPRDKDQGTQHRKGTGCNEDY